LRTQYGGDAPVCQDLPDRRQYQEAAAKPRLVDRFTDVSVGEILEQAIGVEPGRWTKSDQMRVGAYLKAAKWERYRATAGGKRSDAREWRYRRSSQERSS